MNEIQLRVAKATLSSLVDSAREGRPTIITRHGRREALVIGFDEWERLSNVPSLGRLLMAAPLEPGDLPPRSTGGTRDIDL